MVKLIMYSSDQSYKNMFHKNGTLLFLSSSNFTHSMHAQFESHMTKISNICWSSLVPSYNR